jgi:ribulose-5-phosphate 4-epimerase/fuculose-1-phosphate aldolase
MGDAWDRTPHDGDLSTSFVILMANGETKRFSLGAHAPNLSPEEVERIHKLWLRAVKEVGPAIHHHDVVATALSCFEDELSSRPVAAIDRLRRHAGAPVSKA